jgi:hypothetical protein
MCVCVYIYVYICIYIYMYMYIYIYLTRLSTPLLCCRHPIIKKLNTLTDGNPKLAELVTQQVSTRQFALRKLHTFACNKAIRLPITDTLFWRAKRTRSPFLLQLFSNAMVAAGLVEDPRTVVTNMNDLLTLALEKH